MAGKADLVNSIVDSVDVVSFEVLPFGLDPFAGAAADVAGTDVSATIDPNGGGRTR